jgi:glucose dehydrogenase
MRKPNVGVIVVVLGALVFQRYNLSPAQETKAEAAPSASVSDAQIVKAESQPGNWLTYGRTYSEQRFSPLRAINVLARKYRSKMRLTFATSSFSAPMRA